MNTKKLIIVWQRLIVNEKTCFRCGATETELNKAVKQLKKKISPMGIEVILKKSKLTLKKFENNPTESNKITINDIPLEKLINAKTKTSRCCGVCNGNECRTMVIDGQSQEVIKADVIIKAGLKAL